jgi:hypothetical protein
MAIAIADNVPVGIRSEADLQELETPPGEDEVSLIYAMGAEKKWSCYGNALKPGASLMNQCPKSAFVKIHKNCLTNAGYPCRPSVHNSLSGFVIKYPFSADI